MTDTMKELIQSLLPLIGALLAAIPGLLALNRQKQVADAKKTQAEAEQTEAVAADQIAKTALDLVHHHEVDTQRSRDEADRYRKMVEDYDKVVTELRNEFRGCKEQLTAISLEMGRVVTENAALKVEVKSLKDTVTVLTEQLKEAGIPPKYGKREEDAKEDKDCA